VFVKSGDSCNFQTAFALCVKCTLLLCSHVMCDGAGQLAGTGWRSAFGRPSKLPTVGDVDPTGSYCPVPEDWLARKYGMPQARPV
jgi:hypothetical protein